MQIKIIKNVLVKYINFSQTGALFRCGLQNFLQRNPYKQAWLPYVMTFVLLININSI